MLRVGSRFQMRRKVEEGKWRANMVGKLLMRSFMGWKIKEKTKKQKTKSAQTNKKKEIGG